MIRNTALYALAGAAVLAACVADGAPAGPTPAWFSEREAAADGQGAPSLSNIPRGTDAVTDQQHWADVQREMDAAMAQLRASPRATYQPGDPAAEEAEARRALEATRSRY